MMKTIPWFSWRALPVWALLLTLFSSGQALAQAPANDDCAQAVPITATNNCSLPLNGTVAGATQSLAPNTGCGFATTALDVWYSFTAAGASQQLTLAPRFAAVMDVRSGTCTNSTSVFCTTVFNNNTAATLVTGLVTGQTYFVRIYANSTTPPSGISSTFALCAGVAVATPVNDDCAGAISVPVTSGSTACTPTEGDNTLATSSVGAPAPTCANYQGRDLWFSVIVPASGGLTVQTVVPASGNGVGDTGMSIYSGTCNNLVQLGCDDDGAGGAKSILVFSGRTPGEVLYVRVWAYGNNQSGLLAVCAAAQAPLTNDNCVGAISLPVNTTCTTPLAGTLTGASQSLPPIATCGVTTVANDVWYSFVAGGTTQTLTFTGNFQAVIDVRSGTCATSTSVFCGTTFTGQPLTLASLTSGQTYFLRLYANNNFTPVNSTFTLCLTPGPTPATNDECANATPLPVTATCATPVNGTFTGATQSLAPLTTCGLNTVANDVWYSFVAGGTTQILNMTALGFPTIVDVRSGTCTNSASVFCSTAFSNQPLTISGLTSGQTYFLRLYVSGNFTPVNPAFTLCLNPGPTPATNDECANATPLPVTATCATPVNGTITGASQSLPPLTTCGFNTVANDVWFSFVANGPTQILTLAGGFSAIADVRSGTCTSSTSIFCGTAFINQPLTISGLTSGQTYFLRLYLNGNFTPVNPAFTVCLNPGPTPPVNDNCAGAIALPVATSCVAPVSGTVAAASPSLPVTTNCGFATVANDVWYSFTAGGTSQTLTFAGNFQAVIDVRSGTCASSTSIFCGTVFTGQSTLLTGLTSGQTYFLRLYANATVPPLPTNSAFTLCLTAGAPPLTNDDCSTAVAVAVVQNCATSTNGTVFGASQSLPPTANCGTGVTTAADVWYSFVASSAAQLITLTPRFASVLDVRSGTCASSTSLLCASVFANSTVGTVVGGLTSGQTYYIRIYANGTVQPIATNATFTLCVSPAPTPPANDECAGAIPVPVTTACTTPVSGTVEAASQSLPGTTACGLATNLAQDVWYSFVASGQTQLLTVNPRFTAIVDVRSGTCANSTSLTCASVFAGAATSTVVGGLTSGQTYFIRVYASGTIQPTAINATFTLCLNPGPIPPVNDECATAILLPVTTTCTPTSGTVAAASQSLPATIACNTTGSAVADVWYSFVANGNSQSITLAPDQGSFVLDVRSGTCANSTSLFCTNVFAGNTRASLIGGLTNGQTYFIRIYSVSTIPPTGAAATFTLCVTTPPLPPVNDDCATAITIPVQFGAVCVSQTSASNIGATSSTGVSTPLCAAYQGGDLWFSVTVPASGTLTVRTVVPATGNDVGDTGLSMYSGTCANLTEIGCDDDAAGNLKSLLTFTGRTPGEVLYIRVWAYGGTGQGNIAVCATSPTSCLSPTAPVVGAITSSTAQGSWQPGGTPAAGTTYSVEYGPQGFLLGAGTTVTGLTTPTVQFTGLQSGTAYCFYIQQICPGTTGSSAYVGSTCFTTTAVAACPSPSALTVGTITPSTVQLNWQAGGTPAAGTLYTVEVGPQGFLPGSGQGIVASGIQATTTTFAGLLPATNYCFYVTQNCPGGVGSSNIVGPVCFQTLANTNAPANNDPCGAVTLVLGGFGNPILPITGTNVGATTTTLPGIALPSTCSPNATPADVWFAITPLSSDVLLTPTGGAAGMVRVYAAPSCSAGPFTLVSCQSSGAANTGITNVSLFGLVPGQRYYVAVSGYGATDTPGTFTLAGVSIVLANRAQAETNALLVYPNPSSTGQLTLKLGNALAGPAQASLINAIGQVVRTEALRPGATQQILSTHGLATGLYTVRIVAGSDVFTRKVVLE